MRYTFVKGKKEMSVYRVDCYWLIADGWKLKEGQVLDLVQREKDYINNMVDLKKKDIK